jgi:hypothetical protein
MFPVRYGLYLHISFGRNSVFKGLRDNYVRSFCQNGVSVHFVWFSQQTATVSLNSINRLGFAGET